MSSTQYKYFNKLKLDSLKEIIHEMKKGIKSNENLPLDRIFYTDQDPDLK